MSLMAKFSKNEFPNTWDEFIASYSSKSKTPIKSLVQGTIFYISSNGRKQELNRNNFRTLLTEKIEIYAEKPEETYIINNYVDLENDIMESIVFPEKDLYADNFEKLFGVVCKEIERRILAEGQTNYKSIEEVISNFSNKKRFEILLRIFRLFNKEKEVLRFICSQLEEETLNVMKENEILLKDFQKLTSDFIESKQVSESRKEHNNKLEEELSRAQSLISKYKSDMSTLKQGTFLFKKEDISKKMRELAEQAYQLKTNLTQVKTSSEKLNTFIINDSYLPYKLNDTKTIFETISKYFKSLNFIPFLLFERENLNNLLTYLIEGVRDDFICVICLKFHERDGREFRLCYDHRICSGCKSSRIQWVKSLEKKCILGCK